MHKVNQHLADLRLVKLDFHVFNHLTQALSPFCQIVICPSRIGQTVMAKIKPKSAKFLGQILLCPSVNDFPSSQVKGVCEMYSLSKLFKTLSTAMPSTRVKILKMSKQATTKQFLDNLS